MELSFIVESKTFVFSVLDGASTLRVGEKRQSFSSEIFISSSCSEWLASTLALLVDYPEDQVFIKSFREGSRVLIARRGCNQAGRFLEVASFGMGGRKGFILIPEGRGGWGWIKFSDELRKAIVSFSASVGWGSGLLHESVENKGKKVEAWPGLVPFTKGPSFVEVLKAGSAAIVKKAPIVGGRLSGRMVTPVDQCELDLLPAMRVIDADLRSALDCSTLESSSFDLLGKDQPHRLMGKTYLPHASLKFEISKLRTWSKQVIGFNLALGRAAKKLLGRLARNGLRRKGLRLGRFLQKPNSSGRRVSRRRRRWWLFLGHAISICRSFPLGILCAKTDLGVGCLWLSRFLRSSSHRCRLRRCRRRQLWLFLRRCLGFCVVQNSPSLLFLLSQGPLSWGRRFVLLPPTCCKVARFSNISGGLGSSGQGIMCYGMMGFFLTLWKPRSCPQNLFFLRIRVESFMRKRRQKLQRKRVFLGRVFLIFPRLFLSLPFCRERSRTSGWYNLPLL